MRNKNRDKDTLDILFRQACPEPEGREGFTGRVMNHIASERRREKEANEYWQMLTGHSYGTSWRSRMIAMLLSPVVIIVVAAAALLLAMLLYSSEIMSALECVSEYTEGISRLSPYAVPCAAGLVVAVSLCCAIALIHSDDV